MVGTGTADKSRIRKTIYQLQRVKTWQLILILLLVLFIAATLLRINNVGMVQRRDAVLAADKENRPDETRSRLYDLQRYAAAHMNADTGVFYLQEQYDRDAQKAIDAIKSVNGGQSVNAKAEAVCKPQFTHYTYAYTQCMLNEITKANQVVDPTTLPKMPDPSLYRYSFTAPLLSLDFAGLAVGVSVAILLVIITRGVSLLVLKMLLKRHYRGV